jgi:hypothetical protein
MGRSCSGWKTGKKQHGFGPGKNKACSFFVDAWISIPWLQGFFRISGDTTCYISQCTKILAGIDRRYEWPERVKFS